MEGSRGTDHENNQIFSTAKLRTKIRITFPNILTLVRGPANSKLGINDRHTSCKLFEIQKEIVPTEE